MQDSTIGQLALSVARCEEVSKARHDDAHPCHEIVNVQPAGNDTFQVPEAWAGNLENAKVVFVSSNPNISVAGDKPHNASPEDYPTADWDDEKIVDFMTRRFTSEAGWATADGRTLKKDGTYSHKVKHWTAVQRIASELLGFEAGPGSDYVMTEVVHCKSKREIGVQATASFCGEKHLERVLSACPANLVIILGQKARDVFNEKWGLPIGFGVSTPDGLLEDKNVVEIELGGRRRTVIFLWHPSKFGLTKEARRVTNSYPKRFPELQAAARGTNDSVDRWSDLEGALSSALESMPWNDFLYVGYEPEDHDSTDTPYAQANPSADGVWCEVVSERFINADVWPSDPEFFKTNEWWLPSDDAPNWTKFNVPLNEAAAELVKGMRHGRHCVNPELFVWKVGSFPSGPRPDGGISEPIPLKDGWYRLKTAS